MEDDMMSYTYKVTGLYDDWCEIYMDGKILYIGSVFRVIEDACKSIRLRVDYGKKDFVHLSLKKSNHLILGIPNDTYIENKSYIPVIFTEDEFLKLLDISYIDKKLVHIPQATHEDLLKLWYSTSNQKVFSNYDLRNLIAYTDYDDDIVKILSSLKDYKLEVIEFSHDYEDITAYLEIKNKIYEWNAFVKYDGEIHLKLTDQYGIKLKTF